MAKISNGYLLVSLSIGFMRYVNCLMFCSTFLHRRETGPTNQDRSGVRESFSDSMKPTGNMGKIGRR